MKLIRSVFFFVLLIVCALFWANDAIAATFTVTKTADTNDGTCDADCSLREAITAANTNPGHDTVEFNIPTSDPGYIPATDTVHDYWQINLLSQLSLTDSNGVWINGYSQIGSSRNTAQFGQPINTILKISVLVQPSIASGVVISGGNNRLSGLNIRTTRTANSDIQMPSSNNWIEGNFIGTDILGVSSQGGGSFLITASDNTFGTNGDGIGDVGERNLITLNHNTSGGNAGFLHFYSVAGSLQNIKVSGNYMGVNASGNECGTQIHAGSAIWLWGVNNSLIGSNFDGVSDDEESNILGCVNMNERAILRINTTLNVIVQHNFIGVSPLGNALSNAFVRAGISIRDQGATMVTIKRNTIGYINGSGIAIESPTADQITILDNQIFHTEYIPIDLLPFGDLRNLITPNDPGDLDTGPNDLMNHPEIRHANHLGDGRYAIGGIIDGNLSEAPFTIELCRSSNHPSGHGGCIETLATTTTTGTDWEVFVSTSITNPEELSLSALATNSRGSTSEFSRTVTAKTATPLSLPLPLVPDVVPGTGASITKDSVVAVAESHTFNYDAYLSTITTSQTAPYRLPGNLYFQASPIQEIWWKAHANDAKILDSEVNTGYIIALKYQPSSLDPNLNPRHLRLAYRPDSTSSWKVLYNSVHDPTNYTVATVTKTGGEYMLVSRW